MRVLFASLPALGHTLPLCSLAAELRQRGHTVGWVAHDSLTERLLPRDADVFPISGPAAELARPRPDRPAVGLRQYFGELLPRASAQTLPAVTRAIADFEPDLLVVEEACLAGSIAARRAGLPWVSVHPIPTLHLDRFLALPTLVPWIDSTLGQVQRLGGVEPLPWPIRSPHLTLIVTSREFLGPGARIEPDDRFVGALVEHRAGPLELDLGPRPRILVSLGTIVSGSVEPAPLDKLGTTFVAGRQWLPQLALMPHLDLVVCHGGQNTVTEALLHGVPLVLTPVQHDQPMVASRVASLGAGLIAPTTGVRAAAEQVLADPSFAAAARRIGATLGPGSTVAAELIEELAP